MNLLTQHWLASISCLCFIHLMIGISALDYLDIKLYEIEMGISRLKNLDKLVRPGGTAMAQMHHDWFLGTYEKILIPPSKRGVLHWAAHLLLAIPFGISALMLNFSTLGDYKLIPDRFSFIGLLLWPRTFSRSIRKIQNNHLWYAETKIQVMKEIRDLNSL